MENGDRGHHGHHGLETDREMVPGEGLESVTNHHHRMEVKNVVVQILKVWKALKGLNDFYIFIRSYQNM